MAHDRVPAGAYRRWKTTVAELTRLRSAGGRVTTDELVDLAGRHPCSHAPAGFGQRGGGDASRSAKRVAFFSKEQFDGHWRATRNTGHNLSSNTLLVSNASPAK
jgi:hypothetical protein